MAEKVNLEAAKPSIKKWIEDKLDSAALEFMEKIGFELCCKDWELYQIYTEDELPKKGDFLKNKKPLAPGFDAMTSSQIRNIYTEIKRIQVKAIDDEGWANELSVKFLLLKPKVAYASARVLSKARNSRIVVFRKVFDIAHTAVRERKHFENFCQLMEGILAYHKVYGGKD